MILYENADKNKNTLDAETLNTSNLSNKIICRPPKSCETVINFKRDRSLKKMSTF